MNKQPLARAMRVYVTDRARRQEISAETGRSFRQTLGLFAAFVGLDRAVGTISRADVERWVASMDVAPATLQLRLSTLRGFFAWATENELCKRNPAAAVRGPRKPRRVPRHLRPEDVEKVIATSADAREQLIVTLMVSEGLRACEVSNLELADVDRGGGTIAVTGKGGHQRILPLTEETARAIDRYLPERGRRAGRLVQAIGNNGRMPDGLSAVHVARIAGRALKRQQIDETGHSLRHTFAKEMIDQGADLLTVRDALGHKDVSSTQIYTGFMSVGKLREVMGQRRYDRPLAGAQQ